MYPDYGVISTLRTRRYLLKQLAFLPAAATQGDGPANQTNAPESLLDVTKLDKFVHPLPVPRIAKPVGVWPEPGRPQNSIPRYRLAMRQFRAQVHRDMKPTTFWGYGGACPGPTLEVRNGKPVLVDWVNALPMRHFLPIDHRLHGAEMDKPEVRAVVHLHGGRVPPGSDGYPEAWVTPGHSIRSYYPNSQNAALLFYHDHAMGITRLNNAAGLMGLYIIRDEQEDSLHLPSGPYEIPLVLFDRSFRQDGTLYYPQSGDPGAPWVSEYYGGAILVNGKLFPFLNVKPRKYRFRVANTANGSFFTLTLGSSASLSSPKLPFYQIGTDQGLLPQPVEQDELLLGPGERADLVIDFSAKAANFGARGGRQLYLRTAVTPILQFRVTNDSNDDRQPLPSTLRPIDRIPESAVIRTRELTLADYQDRLGRSKVMLLNGTHWSMPVSERPVLNTIEIWNLINLTDDSHPIHLHEVRFQVLDRRRFDLPTYQLTKRLVFTSPALPTDANDLGWKDTVRADPMTVTRIIVKFEGYAGRYVWHCHILEHEDNEMMRPYEIVSA
ncbi:MAG: multicopper oxidase domain-containing protein [Acidobacteriia bacterium]|nr:multicopper oxidase domain-containing protein [Terriglobia bacterium]